MNKIEERFWSKVNKTPKCWLWCGTVVGGYGQFWNGKKLVKAHRWVMDVTDPKIEVDHGCRNTICVRPEHLERVTHQENCRRRSAITTHCPEGHAYDKTNTRLLKGRRYCRKCQTKYKRAWLAKRREMRIPWTPLTPSTAKETSKFSRRTFSAKEMETINIFLSGTLTESNFVDAQIALGPRRAVRFYMKLGIKPPTRIKR